MALIDGSMTCRYPNVNMNLAAAVDARPISQLFRALSDESRLRIVALLAHGELCVCHVEEALGLSQPTVSRHLGVLRTAGVVDSRRDGSWVYYRLAKQGHPDRARLMRELVKGFAKRDLLRRDLERLVRVRGPQACK
jgi:ArsR family transcriptional regulator, arsenate/arsenite/antimonite-responsive transcriptional repressor